MILARSSLVKLYALTRGPEEARWSLFCRPAAPSREQCAIAPPAGSLRPSEGPQLRRVPRSARGGASAAAVVAAVLALAGAAAGQQSPSAEALVVRGIDLYEHREMREGTRLLERAVSLRPDWTTGRMALAAAHLRGDRFELALAEYEALVGSEMVRALAAGDARAADLPAPVDVEAVLGAAVAYERAGRLREADRLYRCAADLWGPASRESARAYFLLAEMLDRGPVPWGDPGAERAKAMALAPGVAGSDLLPPLPDPSAVPELQPYTWPVAPAERDSLVPVPDVLPVLAEWPAPETKAVSEFRGTVTVEALVSADGRVSEAAVTAPASVSQELKDAVTAAVSSARFDPATAGGVATEAWIAVEIPSAAVSDPPEPGSPAP